jgi:steroid 5-alpha reductase family enzyme
VFVLQGIFLYIISAPVLFIHRSIEVAPGILDFVAIGLWITGFIFEAVADIQLSRFIADRRNKGRLMTTGLWRFSRHPNYFGEVTQWWAIYLLALKLPFGFISIVGPALITVLILFVSGVPLLEKKYEGRADFAEYKRRTSVFVPLPSRKV